MKRLVMWSGQRAPAAPAAARRRRLGTLSPAFHIASALRCELLPGGSAIRRSLRALLIMIWLTNIVAAGRAAAQPLSAARQREIVRQALRAYDQATALLGEDPVRAAELYRQAAGGFQALVDAGLDNAALEYNLGNIYFRLGQLGQAILHYRRAERLGPRSPQLQANLRYARDRVEPHIAVSGQARLTHQLLFWHYQTSLGERFWGLVILSAGGWPLLLAWLRWPRRSLLVAGLVAVALALISGSSLIWQMRDENRRPHAVIVAREQYLRLARGDTGDLALKQPLGPGVELRILQEVGEWVYVRLPNGQTGWLPATAVERL